MLSSVAICLRASLRSVVRLRGQALTGLFVASSLAACNSAGSGTAVGPPASRSSSSKTPIQHVVIIIQENRSFDNLFEGFPGANTQSYGLGFGGKIITLRPNKLAVYWDLSHAHSAFESSYDNGKLEGWDAENCTRSKCPPNAPYSYVRRADIQPYWTMASSYALGDNTFQSNQGPSFPAHQYAVSGTSTIGTGSKYKAAENPGGHKGQNGGCTTNSLVRVIGPNGHEGRKVDSCFIRSSIFTLLDAASLPWRYYQSGAGSGIWKGVNALKPIWSDQSEYQKDVITHPAQVISDVHSGFLAAVTFVTPTLATSDHPGDTNGTGPAWVASVVNAIGESRFWDSTAIFVTWDDWGGWYDHVVPPIYNSYELGFRVPLIAISPYARAGYVSHVQHENFGSILHYTEEVFNLPSLHTTDARADNLSDMFDYGQSPIQFVPIQGSRPASYWYAQRSDSGEFDD
jgi:phospholipase C